MMMCGIDDQGVDDKTKQHKRRCPTPRAACLVAKKLHSLLRSYVNCE
jgi:hypothetical protein